MQTFANSPSIKGALDSPDSQALLYSLIRLLRPDNAVEIGTYMASTTEAMARAIADNGTGMLQIVDPFGAGMSPRIIGRWPRGLQNVTRLHLINSMMFFAEMQKNGERTDLVFVDGNHDYEFALFDIQCAARVINPGGFIVIDNIASRGLSLLRGILWSGAAFKGGLNVAIASTNIGRATYLTSTAPQFTIPTFVSSARRDRYPSAIAR